MTPAALLARYDAAQLAERLAWLLHRIDTGISTTPIVTAEAAIHAAYRRKFGPPHIWPQVPMQERRSVIRAAAPKAEQRQRFDSIYSAGPLEEASIRDIANGLNGVQPMLGQWERDLLLARAVERRAVAEERERCAQACDDHEGAPSYYGNLIRNRR